MPSMPFPKGFSVYSHFCLQTFQQAKGINLRDRPDLVESTSGLPLYWSSRNTIHIKVMPAKLLFVTMLTGFKRKPTLMWRLMAEHQIHRKVEVPDGCDSVCCHFHIRSVCLSTWQLSQITRRHLQTQEFQYSCRKICVYWYIQSLFVKWTDKIFL